MFERKVLVLGAERWGVEAEEGEKGILEKLR